MEMHETKLVLLARLSLTVTSVAPFAALVSPLWASDQILTLSAANAQRLEMAVAPNQGPEGDWGHSLSTLVGPEGDWGRTAETIGSNMTIVVSNDGLADAQRVTELLTMGKLVFESAVLPASGQIGAWLAQGEIGGIELDLFGEDDPQGRPSQNARLSTRGVLRRSTATSPYYADVGFVYCYDAQQLAVRIAELEYEHGSPLVARRVYCGPVLQSSASGNYSMYLPTTDTVVQGDVLTNGTFRLEGNDNTILELYRHRQGTDLRGSGHVLGISIAEPVDASLPLPASPASYYGSLATANDTFFDHSIEIVMGVGGLQTSLGIPLDGVVYSTGDIRVSGQDVYGTLTLVAEGSVEFGGRTTALTACADGVLAWSVDDGDPTTASNVVVSGDDNVLGGRMYAPGGQFQLIGDRAAIVGNVIANQILISGDGHSIGDGTLP